MKDAQAPAHPTSDATAHIQTPPDVKIQIADAAGTPLIRMVGIGESARGRYYQNREYWRHGPLSSTTFAVDTLTLSYEQPDARTTEQDINEFFGPSMTVNAIDCGRTRATWLAGKRESPLDRVQYLFSMADPDNADLRIGVVIETAVVGSATVVKAMGFYKLWARPDGQIWSSDIASFSAATLTRARNRANGISTDPADIAVHHTLMESS